MSRILNGLLRHFVAMLLACAALSGIVAVRYFTIVLTDKTCLHPVVWFPPFGFTLVCLVIVVLLCLGGGNMRIVAFIIILLGWAGCSHLSPRAEFERRFNQMKLSPIMSDVVGRYVHNSGLGGGALNLRRDSTFYYETWGCIPEAPIVGYTGTYVLIKDTLNLTSAEIVLRDSEEASQLRAEANATLQNKPRYLTRHYSPSFFFRYESNIYLASHEHLEAVTDISDFQSKVGPLMGWFLMRQDDSSSAKNNNL